MRWLVAKSRQSQKSHSGIILSLIRGHLSRALHCCWSMVPTWLIITSAPRPAAAAAAAVPALDTRRRSAGQTSPTSPSTSTARTGPSASTPTWSTTAWWVPCSAQWSRPCWPPPVQIFHMCDEDGRRIPYMCANETSFNQKFRVCDWNYNVDCASSPDWWAV